MCGWGREDARDESDVWAQVHLHGTGIRRMALPAGGLGALWMTFLLSLMSHPGENQIDTPPLSDSWDGHPGCLPSGGLWRIPGFQSPFLHL